MTTLAMIDLNISKELDTKALTEITGRGHFHKISSYINTGRWSAYRKFAQGSTRKVWHYGKLMNRTTMGYKRSRVQVETSYWNYYS